MTRAETRRALFRHHLYLPPLEKVGVVFVVRTPVPPDVGAQFECLTCACALFYDHDNDYWLCPDCEYELTLGEARDLHDLTIKALDDLCLKTKRSLLWDLVHWWQRRRGQRHPKKLPLPPKG